MRLSHARFGVRRALSTAQRDLAATVFGAEGKAISAGKKLLDTNVPAYTAVTKILAQTKAYWKAMSVPYPEKGIRLIRRSQVAVFESQMAVYVTQLDQAVAALQEAYVSLRGAAATRLGDLFNADDYPETISDEFGVEWDYPSLAVPEYLKQLNPLLYESEKQRLEERFNVAVRLNEEAFTAELEGLVAHLTDRLSGSVDGKPKIIQERAIGNFQDFFERFQTLAAGSNAVLDGLVAQAKEAVAGVDAGALRSDGVVRKSLQEELGKVREVLDAMIVDRPKRAITLPAEGEE